MTPAQKDAEAPAFGRSRRRRRLEASSRAVRRVRLRIMGKVLPSKSMGLRTWDGSWGWKALESWLRHSRRRRGTATLARLTKTGSASRLHHGRTGRARHMGQPHQPGPTSRNLLLPVCGKRSRCYFPCFSFGHSHPIRNTRGQCRLGPCHTLYWLPRTWMRRTDWMTRPGSIASLWFSQPAGDLSLNVFVTVALKWQKIPTLDAAHSTAVCRHLEIPVRSRPQLAELATTTTVELFTQQFRGRSIWHRPQWRDTFVSSRSDT